MFVRFGISGQEIIIGADGWSVVSDGINEADADESIAVTDQGLPPIEREVSYRLLCERSTRSALMTQIEKLHQICALTQRATASSAGLSTAMPMARITRGDGSFAFARVSSATAVCERIARTAAGWAGFVTLNLTLIDPWLGPTPPTSGGAANNADRIVRSSIPGWRREDITFATASSHAAPATWVVRHPDGYIEDQRIFFTARRATYSGNTVLGAIALRPYYNDQNLNILWDNLIMRAYSGSINNQTNPVQLRVKYQPADGWTAMLASDIVDVWLLAKINFVYGVSATIEVYSLAYASPPLWYFAPNALNIYLGRFSIPLSHRVLSEFSIEVIFNFPASGISFPTDVVVGGLVLANPVESMVAASRTEMYTNMPAVAWCHGAVNDVRFSLLASGLPGGVTDVSAYTDKRLASSVFFAGNPNLTMYDNCVACVGALSTALSSQTWTIRRRAIALSGA